MSTSPSFQTRKLPLILIILIGVLSASAITFGDNFLLRGDAHEGLSSAASSHTQQLGSSTTIRAASVSTDKSDYKPGEIVQITGSGFAPNEPVTLQVVHVQPTSLQFSSLLSSESAYDHAGHEPWQVLVGADGSFTSTWLVQEDSLNQTLLLTADQPATVNHAAIHAETTFTDSSIETYDQCSNDDGDGYTTGDTGCRWINGNLNKNNSTYREGEATVQRLAIYEFEPGSNHTVTFQYGTTKAGKHAYDFLTTWDWSEDWILLADRCQDLVGCTTATETYFDIPQDPNVPNSFEPSAPGDRQFTMRGGTLTGVSTPSLVSGDYTGDSETAITVSFTVANSGPMCSTKGGTTTCGVAIWFGAHIAKGDDWGPPGGASDIPGSPYHVSLDKLDGASIGERDNQMQSDTVVPPPNLVISKTAANTPINAGDVASFTITVTNNGTGPANNVTLSDQLPAGITWTDNSAACSISAGGLLSCSFGNLAAGASVSVTVSGTTDAADCGVLNNLATAQADNNPPVQDDASIVVNCPDITVTKVADQGTVSAGTAIGFTITVTNNGPGSATGVTLSDTLPTNGGLAWAIDGGTGAGSCSIAAGVLSCNFGTLANGATRTVHISSPTTAATCGTVNNTVTVAATNEASANTGNNTANASVIVQCPNIAVTKVADQGTVTAGTAIGFTLTVSNSGPGSATGVTLTDTLPSNGGLSWSINGGTGAGNCSITAGVLNCNFGTLASGASLTVHITSPTTSATCGVVNNTGTVAATNEPAANTGNNSASASVTVNCPDIAVDKTPVQGTVSAGTAIAFNIVVSNLGPGSATGVTLTDTLPSTSGLSWTIDVANTDAPGCSITAGVLTCNIGTLAEGASVHVRVTSPTTAATCGTVNNTGTVSATNEDPTKLGNNSDGASIVVQCPDLTITKIADASPVPAGSQIGFTIRVQNNGAGTATGVTVNDPLPAGVSWAIDGPPAAFTLAAGVLSFGPGDLAPGAFAQVHIVAPTTAVNCATIPNTATATLGNGTAPPPAVAQVVVQCPDVSVTKTADAAAVDAPGNVGFTITVFSNGPAAATNVSLTDVLPSNGGLSWSIDGGTGAGSCAIGGSPATLTCAFGTMPAGTNRTVHIVSATTGATCGTVNNTATVAANFEPNTANNSASASELVRCGTIIIIKNAKPANGVFSFTGTGDNFGNFNLTGSTAGNGNQITRTNLIAGNYSATEATQLGWTLTGIGGSSDPNTPYNCLVSGSGGSTGVGVPADRRVDIVLHGGDTVTCIFENTGDGVTRTQGFWATHPNLAIKAWNGGTTDTDPQHTFPGVANTPGIGDNLLCGQPVVFPDLVTMNSSDVMGGFWSDISKTSTGGKRSKTDNSRMSLLQQLIAAELNASAFGSSPGAGSFAAWEAAFCSGNASQLQTAQQQAASFNSQGDSGTFTPGTSANSKLGRYLAKYSRWNILPFGF